MEGQNEEQMARVFRGSSACGMVPVVAQAMSPGLIVALVVVAIILFALLFVWLRSGEEAERDEDRPELEEGEQPTADILEDRDEVEEEVEDYEDMSLAEIKRAKMAKVKTKSKGRQKAGEATREAREEHTGVDEEPAEERTEEIGEADAGDERPEQEAEEPVEDVEEEERADEEPEDAEEAERADEEPEDAAEAEEDTDEGEEPEAETREVVEDVEEAEAAAEEVAEEVDRAEAAVEEAEKADKKAAEDVEGPVDEGGDVEVDEAPDQKAEAEVEEAEEAQEEDDEEGGGIGLSIPTPDDIDKKKKERDEKEAAEEAAEAEDTVEEPEEASGEQAEEPEDGDEAGDAPPAAADDEDADEAESADEEPSDEEKEVETAEATDEVETADEVDVDEDEEAEQQVEARESEASEASEQKDQRRESDEFDADAEPKSFEKGLEKTREGLFGRLSSLFSGEQLSDEMVEEIEEILFTADIGPRVAQDIIEAIEQQLSGDDKQDPAKVWGFIRHYTKELLQTHEAELDIDSAKPFVIMVVGVNGVGKTTTIGKMASKFKKQGKDVLLVAGDTFRAAAVDQLRVWAERTGLPMHEGNEGADPASVVYDGVEKGIAEDYDVVICDTSGRLHTDVNLMEELEKMERVAGNAMDGAPHEVNLVLDANTGQNAIRQAEKFSESLDITGLTLTKFDGTARGGVILGVCKRFDAPVRYVGIGERVVDLRDFDAEEFTEALFM